MEAFLDTVMMRTQGLAAREGAHEDEWKQHSIPWDASIYRSVRVNSLHLATLYMSRQALLLQREIPYCNVVLVCQTNLQSAWLDSPTSIASYDGLW